jgi:hypothetical protein
VPASPRGLDDYLSLDLGRRYTPDTAVFRDVLGVLRLRRCALQQTAPKSGGPHHRSSDSAPHVFNMTP